MVLAGRLLLPAADVGDIGDIGAKRLVLVSRNDSLSPARAAANSSGEVLRECSATGMGRLAAKSLGDVARAGEEPEVGDMSLKENCCEVQECEVQGVRCVSVARLRSLVRTAGLGGFVAERASRSTEPN